MKEFILLALFFSVIFSGIITFGFFELIDYLANKRQEDFNKKYG